MSGAAPVGVQVRSEIRDLVDRYAVSLDRNDRAGLEDVFAPGVTADYDGTVVGPDRAALLDFLSQLEGWADSLHHLGPLTVVVVDDGYEVVVNALVVAITDGGGEVPAILRALRYCFDVGGTAGGLRITQVRHRCLWQSDLTMTPGFTRSELSDRP